MSRIGRMPISIPPKVSIDIAQGNTITVQGPKGALSRTVSPEMTVEVQDNQVLVTRQSDHRTQRALHGLTRALLQNMVTGVTDGFTKNLELVGVGYRAGMQGQALELSLGYSHPVIFDPPAGISFGVDKPGRTITVSGIDKELVGEVSAKIRMLRKPEPYKGKGIRYAGEIVRTKAGKSSKR